MTLQSKILRVATALSSIENLTVYHYWRATTTYPYCIWQEDVEAAGLQGDDHKAEQAIGGTVDYFTRTEFDSNVDSIQSALNGVDGLSFYLDMVQFEDETNLIHYSWTWSIF